MEQIIEAFDHKIYTRMNGEGDPILLLHSLWGDSSLFDRVVEQLSRKYRIIRIDFPGHGNSASPAKNFSFKEFSFVLNNVLEQLGIGGKITIIGHSLGGFAAMAFAKEYPEKVAALVLMHSLIQSPDHKSIKLRERQAKLIHRDKKELLLQATYASNFAAGNENRFAEEYNQLIYTANRVTKEGALAGIHAINTRESSMDFMTAPNIPVLMVVGAQDQVYNPDDQMEEHSNMPHSELLLLHNSGHLGFIEEEEIFISRTLEFLDSVQF